MHGMLSNLPLSMNIEKVIARALVLFHQLPPTQLQQRCEVEIALTYDTCLAAYMKWFGGKFLRQGLYAYCSTSSNVFTVEFPYEYQPWPSVTTPMLEEVLPLPPRRSRLVGLCSWCERSAAYNVWSSLQGQKQSGFRNGLLAGTLMQECLSLRE